MTVEKKYAKLIEVGDYAEFNDLPKDAFIVTATQNLKNSNLFKDFVTLSFSDLIFLAKKNIDRSNTITNLELKYLINKVIDRLFSVERGLSYKNCLEMFVDLFNKLIINGIEEQHLQNIDLQEQCSFVEKDIFAIYIEVINQLKTNNHKTFDELIIEEICKTLEKYNNVVFVGFVFLNDIQELTIRKLQSKNLYFLNKKSNFISDELFKPLLRKAGREVSLQDDVNTKTNTDFKKLEQSMFTNKQVDINIDDKIDVYEPFTNREEEFLFIAKDISEKLRQLNVSLNQYEDILKDFAIIITKNKEELVKILDDAFVQYGLFIPDNKDLNGIKSVYFSKQEFLSSEVIINDKQLDYIEKIKLFNKFRRISVSRLAYRSIDFPIGKFVVEIYKLLTEGLTIERFKNLINTNWYLNDIADTNSLKDFSTLSVYFENLTNLEDWAKQIENLIKCKDEIQNQDNFNRHPLFVVNKKSLRYMQTYISFLQRTVKKLKFNGNIKQQTQNLIETFELADIKAPTKEEQEMLELFVEILKSIDEGESIEVDHTYFADHIEELFSNYYEMIEQRNRNLKINVVNMENYTKYKYVYFPMFEDNKYPRVLKANFPYTNCMVAVLNQLGIQLPKNKQMEYHLKMARHIFKNIFSFTEDKLTFTFVNFENGIDIGISTYAYDIFKTAGKELSFKKRENLPSVISGDRDIKFFDVKVDKTYLNELFYRDLCPKMFYHNVKHNDLISYSSEFLLHFYAKTLLFNLFFIKLSSLNKEYLISSEDFDLDIDNVFQISFNEVMRFFNFFNESVMKDIKITTKKQIKDFIELNIRHGKFAAKRFKLKLGSEKEIIISKTIVKVRKTMVLVNLSKRTRTEFDVSKGLDFLVSNCGGQKYDFISYDEIMNKLLNSSKFDDKMSLVNDASFKVNTQINDAKYQEEGLKKVYDLVFFANASISNFGESISSFCRFCPLNNMCKEVLVDDK